MGEGEPEPKEQSMSEILRLGMAGLGVASTQIMPPIAALPYIKITAAADTRADALAKFRETYGGEKVTNAEAMGGRAHGPALFIATPHLLHTQHMNATTASA